MTVKSTVAQKSRSALKSCVAHKPTVALKSAVARKSAAALLDTPQQNLTRQQEAFMRLPWFFATRKTSFWRLPPMPGTDTRGT
ncbi:MAG TPA: hypothetical protein VHX20_09470 [Terracidiphilus sp.]|nr:hypothetical protein [Terracidiphilus sp.]